MKFLAFPDGFEVLMVRGGHNQVFVDLWHPKKQMLQSIGINDTETSSYSRRPDIRSRLT